MSKKQGYLIVIVFSGLLLYYLITVHHRTLLTESSISSPPPAHFILKPEDCHSLMQCAPGCYRGMAYCSKFCTANIGKASCMEDCMGDEICAMPDYDPFKALSSLTIEQRKALYKERIKQPMFGGRRRQKPADMGESIRESLIPNP